jgi:hypothetical protein
MRDAKVNQIFDGASQVRKMIVGRTLEQMYQLIVLLGWLLAFLQTMR